MNVMVNETAQKMKFPGTLFISDSIISIFNLVIQ